MPRRRRCAAAAASGSRTRCGLACSSKLKMARKVGCRVPLICLLKPWLVLTAGALPRRLRHQLLPLSVGMHPRALFPSPVSRSPPPDGSLASLFPGLSQRFALLQARPRVPVSRQRPRRASRAVTHWPHSCPSPPRLQHPVRNP
jgi:hypothetical protein